MVGAAIRIINLKNSRPHWMYTPKKLQLETKAIFHQKQSSLFELRLNLNFSMHLKFTRKKIQI